MYWVNNTLLLKGEERPTADEFNQAKLDLVARYRVTTAGSAPFMICYAAAPDKLQFFILDRHDFLHEVSYEFLRPTMVIQCIQFLHMMVNITRIMVSVAKQLPPSRCTIPLGRRIWHDPTWITFLDDCVAKQISRFRERYDYIDIGVLRSMYVYARGHRGLVQVKKVPRVRQDGTYVLTMKTRGVEALPCDENELRAAIACVLAGLWWLHEGGFVHRNIHWGNVLRIKPGEYVLIDFEHGGDADEEFEFPSGRWDDGTLEGNRYTCGSDIYELGKLAQDELLKSDVGRAFWENLRNPDPQERMTAAQALEHPWIKGAALQKEKKQEASESYSDVGNSKEEVKEESKKQIKGEDNEDNKDYVEDEEYFDDEDYLEDVVAFLLERFKRGNRAVLAQVRTLIAKVGG